MAKGHIERLPSGSYRVKVYAGTDPVTRRPRRLTETYKTETKATQALGRLLADAEAERAPDQSATLTYLLDRYLEVTDLALSTRDANRGYIERTIKPALGYVLVRKLRPDMLDTLYSHLRRCGKLCDGKVDVDHRTKMKHTCDGRCTPHACKPMAAGTIVRIHAIISAALNLAVRYGWIDRNPAVVATVPRTRQQEPEPPTPKEGARLLNEAWRSDPEFALFLWAAMTTGARRGELIALRENRIDFETQEARVAGNYVVRDGQRQEKEPKSGRTRRLSLDPLTCELFAEHLRQRREAATAAGADVPEDAFVFSPDPTGGRAWNPDTMTHRYERLANKVGVESPLKELRHYTATQLLTGGVDLRTVAGRLGHSGGGVTTLRFYAHLVRPADQKAAGMLSQQLADLSKKEELWELFNELPPDETRPIEELTSELAPRVELDPDTARAYLIEFAGESGDMPVGAEPTGESDRSTAAAMHNLAQRPDSSRRESHNPYETVAAGLRADITHGTLGPGDELPTVGDLAVTYGVSVGTVQRAVALLRDEELIEVARGRRARVI